MGALSSLFATNQPPSAAASQARSVAVPAPLTVAAKINVNIPVIVILHCPQVPLDLGASATPKSGHLEAPFRLDDPSKETVFVEFNAGDYEPKLLGPFHLEAVVTTLDVGDVKLERRKKVDTTRGPEALRNPEVLKSLHVINKEQVIGSGAPTLPRTTHLPQFGPPRPMGVKK